MPVVVPLVFYNALVLPLADSMPVYDGALYFECVQHAGLSISLQSLSCYQHPTFVFALPYAVAAHLFGGSTIAVNAVSLIMGNLAILAMYSIVRCLFPGERGASYMLMTLLFATHAGLLVIAANLNPDLGVAYGTVFVLAFLLRGYDVWAAAAGLYMTFSKEIGVAVYGAMVALELLARWSGHALSRHDSAAPGRARTVLLVPFLALGIYLSAGGTFSWADLPQQSSWMSLADARLPVMLEMLFVLNFAWVGSLICLVAGLLWIIRGIARIRSSGHTGVSARNVRVVLGLTLLVVFAVTRHMPFANLRYLAPAFPLLLLATLSSLWYVVPQRSVRLRYAVLLLLIALQVATSFRTIDPMSRRIFGTFPFGRREILAIGSAAGDTCCGHGRDQLLYSLEFPRALERLQDRALTWIGPTGDTVIVAHPDAWMVHPFNTRMHRRSMAPGFLVPRYLHASSPILASPDPPQEVFFIHYPNLDSASEFAQLERLYAAAEEVRLDDHGYQLRVTRMRKRSFTGEAG